MICGYLNIGNENADGEASDTSDQNKLEGSKILLLSSKEEAARGRAEAQQAEAAVARAAAEALKADAAALRAEGEALRAEAAAKRKEVEACQAEAAAKRKEVEAYRTEAAAKRKEVEALRAEAASKRMSAELSEASASLLEEKLRLSEINNNSTLDIDPKTTAHPKIDQGDKKQLKKPCVICEKPGHDVEDCSQFKDADLKEKWSVVIREKLCFRCLRYKSKKHQCTSGKCNISGCSNTHHPLLHKYSVAGQSALMKLMPGYNKEEKMCELQFEPHTYLMVLPVTVTGPAGDAKTWALFGSASEVSLIDTSIADKVGAVGPPDPLYASGIFGQSIEAPDSHCVKLTLTGHNEESYCVEFNTMRDLQLMPHCVSKEDIADCPHLQDISSYLVTEGTVSPKIMIGADFDSLFSISEVRKGEPGLPDAALTRLGWVILGTHNRIPRKNNYFTSSVLIRKK